MLRSALSELFGSSGAAESALSAIGINPTDRGESLSLSDFIAIARLLPIGD
jgi:16S rRNA (adenine1518-N6/adenine1519-N6)-dimethyltransferase